MSRLGWLLPPKSDVLGILRLQASTTVEGMDALVAWAGGDSLASDRVREAEHEADVHKRALRVAVRRAFITPIAPEDLFVLSGRLDSVMNEAKDTVREAELLKMAPDGPILAMSERIAEGVRRISQAFDKMALTDRSAMDGGPGDPTVDADAAVKTQRALEWVYRGAMAELLTGEDLREITGRRELYRRFSRMSETLVEVAERIWYATVKEP
ncbi:MAG: DUF47 domain-containing protein [Candidatus Limnocylindrales bacterium]